VGLLRIRQRISSVFYVHGWGRLAALTSILQQLLQTAQEIDRQKPDAVGDGT